MSTSSRRRFLAGALATLLPLAVACGSSPGLGPVSTPPPAPPTPAAIGPAPSEAVAASLDQYLAGQQARQGFSGAVLVARGGEVILRKGYGPANREFNLPNAPEIRFRAGSIAKTFTALGILFLQDRGMLQIDDSITRYIANAPPSWKPITLRHLLDMTSGLDESTAFPQPGQQPTSSDAVIAQLEATPLKFAPGSRFDYVNSNYLLLGRVVEIVVPDQTYPSFVATSIFAPLKLSHSRISGGQEIVPDRASGYTRPATSLSQVVNAPPFDFYDVFAAAEGLITTVDDLYAWDQALYTTSLVSQSALTEMFTPGKGGFGLGWLIDQDAGQRRISQSGGIPGYLSYLGRYPDARVTIAILSNFDGVEPDPVAGALLRILLGLPPSGGGSRP